MICSYTYQLPNEALAAIFDKWNGVGIDERQVSHFHRAMAKPAQWIGLHHGECMRLLVGELASARHFGSGQASLEANERRLLSCLVVSWAKYSGGAACGF